MTLKRLTGGLMLAPAAALLMAAMPDPAVADPPFSGRGAGAGGCPPGLAKQNRECMPPGQYKKFHRGDRIPDFRDFESLAYREYGLPAPGPGRRYIRRGDEVYLIAEGTQRVLEAIRLFGAVD